MIYVNKNKARIIVPRINQSPEYEQNKVVDIIVTNQVTKETRELQLIDESTDKNYYEFDNPLHYDVRGYEGTYDYKIVFGNGSVVLSSGIVVVEPDNVADNVTDVKSYEYYPDKIVQYTPNTEYVPQVESIKEIKINGDYWVKYYDRVIVDVPIPDITEFEQQIENLNNEIDQLETENGELTTENSGLQAQVGELTTENGELQTQVGELTTENGGLQAQVGELTTENGELQTQVGELTTENGGLQTQVNNLQTENTTLSNEVTEKEAYINTAKGITITSNGVYTPEEGVVGYNEINVEVEGLLTLVDGTKLSNSTFSTVPDYYDFSEISNFYYMFYACQRLTTIPQINTSNGTNFGYMFYINQEIISIPSLKTSNGTNFGYMFNGCKKLTTIQELDLSNGLTLGSMFKNCIALENITLVGSINADIDFRYCPLLTYDSIKSILTAASRKTNTSAIKLQFDNIIADPNGELATLIGECTTKGWTITGLTLE